MPYPVTLTTDRLILREFAESDWQATLAYQFDPLYLRYYAWTRRTELDVQEFIGMFLAQQAEQPRCKFQFAVTLKEDGRLIGNSGIRINDPEAREANIGYELDPHVWGHGLATEAAHELLRFGFYELGLHRIYAECVAENSASVRVMEKIGMQREGRLRDQKWFKDRWWDTLVYAILEDEWRHANALVP